MLKAEEMSAAITLKREIALQALARAQADQKRYFDAKHKPLVFLPGQLARLTHSGTFRRKSKLGPTSQLVTIVDVVSPGAYRIKVPPGSKMHDVVSVEHLRKYTPRKDGSEPDPEEPSTIEESPRKPVRVCGKRMIENQREFLVVYAKDKDGPEGPEWVEEDDAEDLVDLIKEFRERRSVDGMEDARKGVEAQKKLQIDGVDYADDIDVVPSAGNPRRSGRERKKKVIFEA